MPSVGLGPSNGSLAPTTVAAQRVVFAETLFADFVVVWFLLGRKGSPWFADRMRSALAAMSSAHLPDHNADALVPSVISAMFVQSIVWWLEHDRPCPPHELAEQSSRLIRAAIEAAAGAPDD